MADVVINNAGARECSKVHHVFTLALGCDRRRNVSLSRPPLALVCAGTTAWSAVAEHRDGLEGKTVLVHGTGGVAIFALQIAKAKGANIIVVSRSNHKLARAKALGATDAINGLLLSTLRKGHQMSISLRRSSGGRPKSWRLYEGSPPALRLNQILSNPRRTYILP